MCMKLPCSCSWSIVHTEVKEETFSCIPPFPNVSAVGTQCYIPFTLLVAKWHCHKETSEKCGRKECFYNSKLLLCVSHE
jgi:hypothetical protein